MATTSSFSITPLLPSSLDTVATQLQSSNGNGNGGICLPPPSVPTNAANGTTAPAVASVPCSFAPSAVRKRKVKFNVSATRTPWHVHTYLFCNRHLFHFTCVCVCVCVCRFSSAFANFFPFRIWTASCSAKCAYATEAITFPTRWSITRWFDFRTLVVAVVLDFGWHKYQIRLIVEKRCPTRASRGPTTRPSNSRSRLCNSTPFAISRQHLLTPSPTTTLTRTTTLIRSTIFICWATSRACVAYRCAKSCAAASPIRSSAMSTTTSPTSYSNTSRTCCYWAGRRSRRHSHRHRHRATSASVAYSKSTRRLQAQ